MVCITVIAWVLLPVVIGNMMLVAIGYINTNLKPENHFTYKSLRVFHMPDAAHKR